MTRSSKNDPSPDELKALQEKMLRLEGECRQLRGELETAQSEIAATPEHKTDRDTGSDNVVTLDTGGDTTWAAEEQLAGILEISADAIISIDFHGMIRLFNRGAEAIFGYTEREILGKPLDMLLPKHFRDEHRNHIARFAQSDDSSRLMNSRGEIFGLRKNGGEFPAEASIAKMVSGGRISFTVILRDVSERKQAEFALLENEALFRSVINNLPTPAHIKDPDGCYVMVNPEYERQFGYTDKEVKGRTAGELFPPQIADQTIAQDRKVMESKKTVEYEFTFGEGEDARYFLTIKTPLLDPEGKPLAVVCVETDITRRKQAEAALAQREAQLRQAQQMARIGAFIWDDVGQDCIYCSEELAKLFGVSVDQFLDRWGTHEKFLGAVHADDRGAVDQAVNNAVSGKAAYDIEYRCYDGEGRLLNIREIGEPLLDDAGDQIHTFGTMQDVTALRHTQEALSKNMRATELLRRIATAANEAANAEEVMRFSLREICAYGDWPVGHIFVLAGDGADALVSADIWYMEDPKQFAEIRERTHGVRFESSTGLPGRVIASGEPTWIPDLKTDPRYPGARRLAEIGVRACFVFPVLIGHEVVAALECFAGEVRDPDPHLLDIAAQAGIILGRVLERQRAGQALRDSEKQLRTITDNLPAFIAYMDKDERYRFVNETAGKWYNRPTAEILGKRASEVLSDEVYAKLKPSVDIVLSGKPIRFEESRDLADGAQHVIDAAYIPDFDDNGQTRGFFALIQDITERKKAEEALRESEEQLRTITDNLPVSILYLDKEQRYRFVNKMTESWYDSPASELIGKRTVDMFDTEVYRQLEPRIKQALAGNSVRFDAFMTYPDGIQRYVDAAYLPRFGDDGEVRGYLILLQDISERKKAEEALRESEEQLRTITDNLPAYISYADKDERFRFVNKTAEKWYARPADEILGKTVREVVGAEGYAILQPRIETTLSGETVDFEEIRHFPDGVIRDSRLTYVPHFDEDGQVNGWFMLIQDITERKRAEVALRQNMRAAELLRHIATAANEATDVDQAIQVCLDEVCAYTGWPAGHAFRLAADGTDDVVAAGIWHLDDANEFRAFHEATVGIRFAPGIGLPGRVLVSGEPAWITDVTKDKNYLRAAVAREVGIGAAFAFPVLIGRKIAAVLEFYDRGPRELDLDLLGIMAQIGAMLGRVIERQRAEQALRESEEQLRTITDNLPAYISYADKDERFRFVNKTAENWYARPAADIIGRTVREVIGAEEHAKIQPQIETALSGEAINFEDTRQYSDGAIRDLNSTYVPDFNENGKVRGWFVLIQDITERKRAEVALREGEERLRTMMENSPSAIFLKDLDGRYRLANKKFSEWIGISLDAMLGKTPRQFLDRKDYVDDYESFDREVIEQNRSIQGVQTAIFSDGSTHFLDTVKFPVYDSNGRLMGIGGILTDVTEQRDAEEQLRQAQKMEAVGKLTGGVAHDFNNLLAVILGNTELLREKLGTEDAALQAVTKASLRGAELTQRLLSFSRQQPLKPSAIGLPELIRDMATMLRRTLGEMIEIETRVPDSLWQAQADPGQLENAVLNLAINAQHAMQHGGRLIIEAANVTIDKKAASRIADAIPGAFVVLSMTDTGQGMSAEVLDRAFEPFFTTKDVGEGSGLGLSMVYGFAQQSGGFVTIESVEGTGSCVRLHLPRAVDCKPAAPTLPVGARPEGHGETILVVEDDPDVRRLTVTLLKRLGYTVLQAEDGEMALSMFEENPDIDLLLSDVVLPGDISGPDIADAARRRRPGLNVLFMSGYAEDVVRRQESGTGQDQDAADDLLPKPFSRNDLARKVRSALERGRAESG